MRVESSPNKFIISPAKSILFFDLAVASAVFFLLLFLPITSGIKLIVIPLIAGYGFASVADYRKANTNELWYLSATNQWLLDGKRVKLQSQQFLTRYLMILYFCNQEGKKITQLVPADSLPNYQHIQLR